MKKTSIFIAGLIAASTLSGLADARTARSRVPRMAQEQHIACTVMGCIPVPPQCGQTFGRTRSGSPTGYDVIVCPPGIWPLK